jgi:hypothetical protein
MGTLMNLSLVMFIIVLGAAYAVIKERTVTSVVVFLLVVFLLVNGMK